jgi:hypothetical protein
MKLGTVILALLLSGCAPKKPIKNVWKWDCKVAVFDAKTLEPMELVCGKVIWTRK